MERRSRRPGRRTDINQNIINLQNQIDEANGISASRFTTADVDPLGDVQRDGDLIADEVRRSSLGDCAQDAILKKAGIK